MSDVRAGEVWKLAFGGETRTVKVLAAAGTPGWRNCIDVETALRFLAREGWFVERIEPRSG